MLGSIVLASVLVGSSSANPHYAHDSALLSIPVIDVPAMEGAYAVPTWEMAIESSKAQYQISHRAIARYAEQRFGPARREWATLVIGLGWEMIANVLPLGNGWAHEEGHRAILDQYGMRSFNGIYDLDPTRGAIYVRSLRDEDLVRLKRDHPADSARLAAAGMETMTLLSYRLERDLFFYQAKPAVDWPTLVANATGNAGYMWTCSDELFDEFTDEANRHDGGLIKRRDALGLDCTAWAYDLLRPDEPYEMRGVHPSGVGIDRYRKFGELSEREQKLLRTVRYASLLPLLDPFLFLNNGWGTLDRRATTNASFFMTSFGWTVDQNAFVRIDEKQLLFVLHHHVNSTRWMPGLDAELWRFAVATAGGRTMYVSLGMGVWLQPADQSWYAARAEGGGRMTASLAIPVWRRLELEVAGAYKTAGWIAGVAALDAETSGRVGLNWRH